MKGMKLTLSGAMPLSEMPAIETKSSGVPDSSRTFSFRDRDLRVAWTSMIAKNNCLNCVNGVLGWFSECVYMTALVSVGAFATPRSQI